MICIPRTGTCTKKATEIRVAADVRVAWIDYKKREMCAGHAEEWDRELDTYIDSGGDNRWGQISSWIKARDMGLFVKDGMDFQEAYDLVQSGHGYKPVKGPVRIS